MGISQIVNYLFPLILIPYLIRILGLDLYGVYIIFQVIIFFGLLITTYSYNIIGVKQISNNLHNTNQIKMIFNDILSTKIVLFVIVFSLFSFLPFYIDEIMPFKLEFFFILLNILGYALFPNWYLQGLGRFKELMIINIIYKSLQFFLIILFVKSSSDFLLLNIIYGVIPLLMAIHSLKLAHVQKISFITKNIIKELRDNFRTFLSLLFRNSNSSLVILFIGLNFHLETVAIVGALEKIVKAVRSMFDPIFSVVFQHINIKDKKQNKFFYIDKMVLFGIVFGFIFMILFNTFQKEISLMVFDKYSESYNHIFSIFSIMPLLLILTNIFGIQTLITYNYENKYNNIMVISFIITLCFIVIFRNSIDSLILSLPFVEGFILILTYIYYKRIKKHENCIRT